MRAVAGILLALALATPAYGQDTGTSISAPLEWGTAFAWADANADGRADYCRLLISGPRVACTLSTGAGFGDTIASGPIDAGFGDARVWGDVDGDHRADYCRRVGGGASGNLIQCTRSTGDGFVTDAPSAPLDWGSAPDTAIVDATADGRGDYCRLTGTEQAPNMTCTTSTGSGFGATASVGTSATEAAGRAWVDVTGDGRADFCGVAGPRAVCGTFGGTLTSNPLDAGYPTGRAWADVDADGRADYCRRVGDAPNTYVQCTLSTGSGFGQTVTSARTEWGQDTGYGWVDFDGDGDRDFCRPVGASVTTAQLYCTLWSGADGFGDTRVSGVVDLGYGDGRAWVDHNGDGKADYCRRVGNGGADERVSCTISNGTGFGVAPPVPPPGPAPVVPAPAPAAPARITVTLSFYLSKSRFTTLAVKGVPRGSTVVATCSKGCARKRYSKPNASGTVSLKKLTGGRRMRVGAKITVTVTHAGQIGAVKTLQIRAGRNPKLTTRCIPVGSTKAQTRC